MKRASGVGHLTPFLPGLDTLLEDPEASEIMINGPRNVWVERRGRLEAHEAPKLSSAWLHRAAIHIARPLGLDPAARPILDARLGDGSRVAICTPPAAPEVAITIRRFGGRAFSADDLVRLGSLPEPVLQTAQTTLASRRNILVSVGTGSGKTTLLNALIELLPEDERIVAIEDTLELRIDRANCLRFEAGATLSESRTGPPFRRATQPRELPNAERPSSRIRREPGRRIHLLPRTLRASVRRHRRLRRRLVPRPRQSPLRRPSLYDPTGRERLDPEGARPGDPGHGTQGQPVQGADPQQERCCRCPEACRRARDASSTGDKVRTHSAFRGRARHHTLSRLPEGAATPRSAGRHRPADPARHPAQERRRARKRGRAEEGRKTGRRR